MEDIKYTAERVLVCFAGLSALAIAFIYFYLPETKGMSVEEITARYEEVQETGTLAPVTAT